MPYFDIETISFAHWVLIQEQKIPDLLAALFIFDDVQVDKYRSSHTEGLATGSPRTFFTRFTSNSP